MPNKIIVVDSCEHCPLCEKRDNPVDGYYYVCVHAAIEWMIVDAAVYHGQIDVACPLNDEV